MQEDHYPIRTDLALEAQERMRKNQSELKGVDFHE